MPTKDKTPGGTVRKKTGSAPATQSRKRTAASGTVQTKKRAAATKTAAPEKRTAQIVNAPDVVYTPPIPFSRHRFLLRLLTVVAVVIALVFGMSIFFKVDTVVVSGAEKYTAWEISQASGIQEGDNLLTINQAAASGKIKAALPYVKSVRVGIKLPDTVHIDIVEEEVVYAVKSQDGSWWVMTAAGRIVEQTDSATAGNYTKILGVQLDSPKANADALAFEPAAEDTTAQTDPSTGETIAPAPVTVTAAQKLQTALTVMQQLEANGVIGTVASVNVENISAIELWYGQQYQVELGDGSRMDYKIAAMKQSISQMSAYETGVLDVSKASPQDGVIFSPFG